MKKKRNELKVDVEIRREKNDAANCGVLLIGGGANWISIQLFKSKKRNELN